MNNKKVNEINRILKLLLIKDKVKFFELYKNNFNIKDNKVLFSLEITQNQINEIEELNPQIKIKLKKITWVKDVDFVMTSHKMINFPNDNSNSVAKYIIPVASGKGGVGKSTTSINIALALQSLKKNVGILDADIYGPSLPRLTGINTKPETYNKKIIPQDAFGLQSMSIGYLVPEDTATIWRGPMVMSAVNQLLNDVLWQNLDYLIIDMPPGTGDAQLTLSQKTKLSGAIIVSTPQDLSLVDARKGLNMFKKVNVPILGIIENMSYFVCNNCNQKHEIFGNGGAEKEAKKLGVPFLGRIPIDILLRLNSDEGTPLFFKNSQHPISQIFLNISKTIVNQIEKKIVKMPSINLN